MQNGTLMVPLSDVVNKSSIYLREGLHTQFCQWLGKASQMAITLEEHNRAVKELTSHKDAALEDGYARFIRLAESMIEQVRQLQIDHEKAIQSAYEQGAEDFAVAAAKRNML